MWKDAPTGWSLNVPSLDDMKFTTPNFSLIGSADLFGAFTHIGPLAASLLVFTILLSVFFDAMGVSVGLAAEAGTMKDGKVEDIDKVLLVDAFGSVVGVARPVRRTRFSWSPLPVLVRAHAPVLRTL